MATFNKFTYVTRVSEVGTNGAEAAEMIIANTPGLELYHVANNTKSRFTAYCKVWGDTASLLEIDATSSYLYLRTMNRANTGTIVVNGESYTYGATLSFVNMHASNNAFVFYSLVCDDAVLSIGGASSAISFFKVKKIDTGEIVYGSGNFRDSILRVADGKGNYVDASLSAVLPSSANTGYIRAVPIAVSAGGTVPTSGYPVNPNLMYKIFSNGGSLIVPVWTEVSVGGVPFVGAGFDNNLFIRLD